MRAGRFRRLLLLGAAGLLAWGLAPTAASASVKAAPAQAQADFNGDGRTDLAVGDGKTVFATGERGETVGSSLSAGAVSVLYGSKKGLAAEGNQLLAQGEGGVPGSSEGFESFGVALAAGDFNGDGRADLAIGDSAEDASGAEDAGAVTVIYGSKLGLQVPGAQLIAQGDGGVLGTSEAAEDFGIELATGDFDGNGHDDLAVGDNDEDVGGTDDAGAVNVLLGSPAGLSPAGNQLLAQGADGLLGASGAGEAFGTALAAGRFDRGKRADLAVGDLSENVAGTDSAGAVNVLYGSTGGLSLPTGQLFAQGAGGVLGASGQSESFGGELAAGDFDSDKRTDLVVGDPDEDVAGADGAGAVSALYGTRKGLTAKGNRLLAQGTGGLPGFAAANDEFGAALAAGDFDADGRADLAVGDRDDDAGEAGAGAVNALYGSKKGLKAKGGQLFAQGIGVPGTSGAGDDLGGELATGDFDGDGRGDLALGDSNDNSGAEGAGAVSTLYGSKKGLKPKGAQLFAQGVGGLLGISGPGESFGDELAG